MIERFEIDTEQWAVVPRVPTHEMVMAGYYQQMKYDQRAEMYQAMLAAAPSPEAGQPACTVCHGQTGYEADELYGDQVTGRRWVDCAHCKGDGAEPQQPTPRPEAVPKCLTCNDHGMIGGPSYYQPDEGGVPCPDCTPKTAPRPVPTAIPMSERLPVHTDADYGGLILAFTRFTKEWVLQAWTHVHNCPNAYTHWQRTGLVRPAEVKP